MWYIDHAVKGVGLRQVYLALIYIHAYLEQDEGGDHGHQGGRELEAGLGQGFPHDLLEHEDAARADEHLEFATGEAGFYA